MIDLLKAQKGMVIPKKAREKVSTYGSPNPNENGTMTHNKVSKVTAYEPEGSLGRRLSPVSVA